MKFLKDFSLRLNTKFGAKLAHGSFGRNVFLMFIGTALGQMASVVFSPVLTRIYTPDDFGVLGIYMTVASILSLIASLRYEIAIPLSKSEEEAANMLAVCAVSLIFVCTFLSLFLLLIPALPDYMQQNIGVLWKYRMMIPVGVFAIGAYQIGVAYATHRQSYKIISKTKIYQGYSGPIVQIALGLLGANIWGLIIGFVVGQAAGVSMLFKQLIQAPKKVIGSISIKTMKFLAHKFRNFPLISSFSAIINTLGSDSILLIGIPMLYHSTMITGFLFLIYRIIGRPLLMLSTSILQVYLGDVSKTRDRDPEAMRKRFLKLVRFQFLIVAGWLFIINVSAKYIIPLAFGENWAGAVPYIHILSISYLFALTIHAVSQTLQILERQRLSAAWEFTRFIAIICVFLYGYEYKLDVINFLIVYSSVQAAANIVLFAIMYKAILDLRKKGITE